MTRSLRILHFTLAALVLFASCRMALQSYQIHLDNRKAAMFAFQTFMAHPRATTALLLQTSAALALYVLLFWLIAILGRPFQPDQSLARKLTALIATWFSACWLLLHWNLLAFPRSIWAWAIEPVMTQPIAPLVALSALVWLGRRLFLLARGSAITRRGAAVGLLVTACIATPIAGRWLYLHADRSARTTEVPANIVVIGLDSLRRDIALSNDSPMPNLSAFRQTAYVQRNVVSPLARTFPAWTAMLTGESPATSGIRDNLVAQNGIGKRSVGWKFKARGYRTLYATDETRFSNIEGDFGFDQVISPKPGISDFLLGQFGDQPLINFAIGVPFAEYLLPSLVGNRAFAQSYEPSRFIERLVDSIGVAGSQPTLLAVHLCVAHWPYFSANSTSTGLVASPYLRAVQELDTQFGELIKELRRLGYINDKSLVVLLADHGEGVSELRGNAPEQLLHGVDQQVGTPTPGHGGSLLEPAQWQVFLMFGGHSALGNIPQGASDQLLSLQDLPYALQQLSGVKIEAPYTMDVVHRAAGGPAGTDNGRPYVAMETGFSPKNLNPTRPDGEEALRIAEDSFDVLDDGRVEMKPSVYLRSLGSKGYGVTDGNDVLAIVNTEDNTLLVSTNSTANRWDVFSPSKPSSTLRPPLLDFACMDHDMALRLSAWCPASARH